MTIDRHAIRACYGEKGLTISPDDIVPVTSAKRYKHFETLYKRLASKYGILPLQAQAIIWCEFRKRL